MAKHTHHADDHDQTTQDGPVEEVKDTAQPTVGESSELAEVREQVLRIRSDFENFKRRAEGEQLRVASTARIDVVLELLPVVDNFDRAFKDTPEEVQQSAWYGGIAAIKAQFEKILSDLGIERLRTVGQPFDPEVHEAIAHEPSEDYDKDVVSEEFEAGYKFGDMIVRHARVKVSSGKTK